LWASTSTKVPAYPDTRYVDELIGPHTVNTLPEVTMAAFAEHGTLARTIDTGVDEAAEVMRRLVAVGIDMDDVGLTLEDRGVAASTRPTSRCSPRWRPRRTTSAAAEMDGGGRARLRAGPHHRISAPDECLDCGPGEPACAGEAIRGGRAAAQGADPAFRNGAGARCADRGA
jgi:hypothetical protein